jgi:antibiotic biosynthesis monooxygenase (ABM) superfamily enzyme
VPSITRRWQEAVNHAASVFAGYLGNDVAPGDGGEWTVFYRFDSKPHLMTWLASPERAEVLSRGAHLFAGAWLESDERKQLLREGERFREFALHRISSPFGSWFAPPDGDEEQAGPPNWKTGLSVLVGLYPTVVLLTLAISEIWTGGRCGRRCLSATSARYPF